MRDFSIGEAALVGFRLTRERPRAVAVWAVLNLIFNLAAVMVLVGVGGPAMMALQTTPGEAAAQDPTATLELINQLLPAYGLMLFLWLGFSAVTAAAATRAVQRPDEAAMGYVRLGAEEARVLLVMAAIGLILACAYIGSSLVMGLLLGVVIGATGGGGGTAAAASMAVVLVPVVLLGLLWLWTRFSLAVPMTMARGRVDVFGSWALTRGRSGKIFLTYFVAFALYLLVAMLGLAIFLGVGAVVSGSASPMEAVMAADMSSIGAYFNVLTVTYAVVMSGIGALGMAIILCPPAAIYAALAGDRAHEVF